jgi:hypothetical protein
MALGIYIYIHHKRLYCHHLRVTIDGFLLMNKFIDHLQVVTTSNYNTFATNHSALSLLSLLPLVVTW